MIGSSVPDGALTRFERSFRKLAAPSKVGPEKMLDTLVFAGIEISQCQTT
jgi:hypothetical protein